MGNCYPYNPDNGDEIKPDPLRQDVAVGIRAIDEYGAIVFAGQLPPKT
jgi:hypothetical protein